MPQLPKPTASRNNAPMDELYPPDSIAAGLAALVRRWPGVQSASTEAPVFVLAAGWRSGSTLVQRSLLGECLIWGEPFGHAGLIERLADPLRAFSDAWPEPNFLYRGQPPEALTDKFVANLYPPPRALLDAHLAYFDALLARPARAVGRKRWGLKEVRLSADHAAYFKWLYPEAKFVFLIRNPYDAFRSYAVRRDSGWKWFHRWPAHPLTAELFGRHWRELAGSFLAAGEALGGLVVHYEDLDRGGWQWIRDYLGFELSAAAIAANPPDGGPPPAESLDPAELDRLRQQVEPLAEELGYGEGSPKSKVQGPKFVPPALEIGPRTLDTGRSCPPDQCAILVPVAERIEPACEAGLRDLERRGYRVSRVHGFRQIDLARSQMASDALAAGCQETFWIDADTGFHPDAVETLRAHPHPIVCGIYPKKGKRELAIHALPGTDTIVFGSGGGLVELLYGPTGFLLVRRAVYETLREKLPLPECLADTGRTLVPYFAPLVRPDEDGHWYLAEDFAFCERARQCGYKIFADTTIRLWHIGSFPYGWEDAGRDVRRYATYHFKLTDPREQ
jgi:hypothetical protein